MVLLIIFPLLTVAKPLQGDLSAAQLIHSRILNYSIQYQVYTPENVETLSDLPVVFVTDGPLYLRFGEMDKIIDKLIATKQLQPLIAVFVDSREPGNLTNNRRNSEFWCIANYAKFYHDEFIKRIEQDYPVANTPQKRLIMGASFGGLNAACFGLMIPDMFHNIGMHSPANSQHLGLLKTLYKDQERLPLKLFLSVGTDNDNLEATQAFKYVLVKKGYDLTYKKVHEGHNFKNWKPLIDDLLLTFFPLGTATD